jgi:hypothetical protein
MPGVDDMITFLRLLKISGEKNGVFLKNQCYEYFLQKLAVV